MNIHLLDPEKVALQIQRACQMHERRRLSLKEDTKEALRKYEVDSRYFLWKPDLSYIDPMIDHWIANEQSHYSTVRVFEAPPKTISEKEKRFFLLYGEWSSENRGTGPFESLALAEQWFMNGGR